jgi:hypothetical protein
VLQGNTDRFDDVLLVGRAICPSGFSTVGQQGVERVRYPKKMAARRPPWVWVRRGSGSVVGDGAVAFDVVERGVFGLKEVGLGQFAVAAVERFFHAVGETLALRG